VTVGKTVLHESNDKGAIMSAYFVQPVSELQRLTNEVNACLELAESHPGNEYWQRRLANAIVDEYNAYHAFDDWGELYAKHLERQARLKLYVSSLVTIS